MKNSSPMPDPPKVQPGRTSLQQFADQGTDAILAQIARALPEGPNRVSVAAFNSSI